MKKKLESELVSIAHRILKLKGKDDVIKMHAEVGTLFEKLSVLKFAHENFEGAVPTIGASSIIEMMDKTVSKKRDVAVEIEETTLFSSVAVEIEEVKAEVIEPVKEIISPSPEVMETVVREDNVQEVVNVVLEEEVLTKPIFQKNDLEDLMSGFINMPIFEPVSKIESHISNEKKSFEKRSLNDTIKRGGLSIGLNDKLAFIKHLFEGKNEDYERVMSQLNSFDSYTDAKQFLVEIVKPDYNDWEGKEEVEERFLQILESKFN